MALVFFASGNVLRVTWDDRPIRVLMADPIETFYDVEWPGLGWGLARARTAVYSRKPSAKLAAEAEALDRAPLLPKEATVHRPDLPLRLLRSPAFSWADPPEAWSAAAFGYSSLDETALDASRLALVPFGPKGSSLKPVFVEADNGRNFSARELLLVAQASQQAACSDVRGIGLYRSGIVRGVPSYYLWGASDAAGHAV